MNPIKSPWDILDQPKIRSLTKLEIVLYSRSDWTLENDCVVYNLRFESMVGQPCTRFGRVKHTTYYLCHYSCYVSCNFDQLTFKFIFLNAHNDTTMVKRLSQQQSTIYIHRSEKCRCSLLCTRTDGSFKQCVSVMCRAFQLFIDSGL